jgi:hypothetical protein
MDPRVTELHCIMPMENIESVLQRGILSYERVAELPHHSVALQPIQDKRDQKRVPGGLRLHQYANLYFDARNPMLSKRRNEADSLCVLRVSIQVLTLSGAVLSDQNAASNYARFFDPSQSNLLPFDDIFASDWRHPSDRVAYWRHKARKCAEILIPHEIPPTYLLGAYVIDLTAADRLNGLGFRLPVEPNPVLFFG